ncbi:MAG: 3-deoxy-manno-octulosonate cytidylyltransferase [Bacteroidales bacterium]
MIYRVYHQALKCSGLDRVVVATDDERIAREVRNWNGEVVMTSPDHGSGTERCLEALEKLDPEKKVELVVNIQGDEPFIHPESISEVLLLFENQQADIGTLYKRIDSPDDLHDPNVVKVVLGEGGRALWFSRAPVPYQRERPVADWLDGFNYYRHIGLYAYRSGVLRQITKLPVAEPERAEKLEQLRWLVHGMTIFTAESEFDSLSVDTPEDLEKINILLDSGRVKS